MTFIPGAREIRDPEAEVNRLAGLRSGTAQPGSPEEAEWKVAVAGRDGEILVRAATVSHDRADAEATVHQIGGTREGALMTTFRDAAGEIVLQAQAAAILYIRRDPPG